MKVPCIPERETPKPLQGAFNFKPPLLSAFLSSSSCSGQISCVQSPLINDPQFKSIKSKTRALLKIFYDLLLFAMQSSSFMKISTDTVR